MKTTSRAALLLLSAALLGAGAVAQSKTVKLNGPIYDGNGGPFAAGNVYWIQSDSAYCCGFVPANRTLTIAANAIVKFEGNSLIVQGRLVAGAARFTSIQDDSIGGDTNGDGSKTKAGPGDWSGIEAGSNGHITMSGTLIRYAGRNSAPALHIRNRQAHSLSKLKIEKCLGAGIDAGNSPAVLTGSEVVDCGGTAVVNWAFQLLTNFRSNRATGNTGGNYAVLMNPPATAWPNPKMTMARLHSMNGNGIFVLKVAPAWIMDVPKGHQLTIPKSSVLLFMPGGMLSVKGDLQAQGVTFTSFNSQPQPGDWGGIQLLAGSDASVIGESLIEYAGAGGYAGLYVESSAKIRSTTVGRSKVAGVVVNPGVSAAPTFTGCKFMDNGGVAASGLPWESVAGSSGNEARGNRGGDYFRVATRRMTTGTADIYPGNYPGDVIVLAGRSDVWGTSKLRLHAGTVVKIERGVGNGFSVLSTLEMLGTAKAPVILTSLRDDSVAGDTNKDGLATSPAAGDWGSVDYSSSQMSSIIRNARIRYSGHGLGSNNKRVSIRGLRVDDSKSDAVRVWDHIGPLTNVVVNRAGGHGIVLSGGTFELVHATVSACGGTGIRTGSKHVVRNSISWNNTGGNYWGLTETRLQNSNGAFAGKNGNLNVDPGFEKASGGDLRLSASSPCLGRADLATALAVAEDHLGFPRVLDHALNGQCLPDMGAYERSVYSLKTTGAPRLGAKITMQIQGGPGLGIHLLGTGVGTVFLNPLGIGLVGFPHFLIVYQGPIATPVTLQVPNDLGLVGLGFALQGLASKSVNPDRGGFTDVVRFTVTR